VEIPEIIESNQKIGVAGVLRCNVTARSFRIGQGTTENNMNM
jgi:hypothetical protein